MSTRPKEEYLPFVGLDPSTVFQEARIFHDVTIKERQCINVLTKILYVLSQGYTKKIPKTEATEVFFGVTKLFHSKNLVLRRVIYLALKELATISDDVIIITQSLTRDINSQNTIFKANSIRVLCQILDKAMLSHVDRFFKQAVVDKNHHVAASALVSGHHIFRKAPELIKKWLSEIQRCLTSKDPMIQYLALGLAYKIKKHDRLAVSKLLLKVIQSKNLGRLSHSLLIRMSSIVLKHETNEKRRNKIFHYFKTILQSKNEIILMEVTKAICRIRNAPENLLLLALEVLERFLSSSMKVLKFCSVRIVAELAKKSPDLVAMCNEQLEKLINDPNRTIATLAITTLLKTGNESSVDRLMNEINNIMNNIRDEFKITIVQAVGTLVVKFPAKCSMFLAFLSKSYRADGGFRFKKAIVDSFIKIVENVPQGKEDALYHLCEFVEDCDYVGLSCKILHLLGEEGPKTKNPTRYIGIIYNRTILEKAPIRASAISSLAKFAVLNPQLRSRILILIKKCLKDPNDEVRDRATLYYNLISKDHNKANELISEPLGVPLLSLEYTLREYRNNLTEIPFSLLTVPKKIPKEVLDKEEKSNEQKRKKKTKKVDQLMHTKSTTKINELIQQVPELSEFGKVFKVSNPIMLTEEETEYRVECVKLTFQTHFVFQMKCMNTLETVALSNLIVEMDGGQDCPFEIVKIVKIPLLAFNEPGICYICMKIPEEKKYPSVSFLNTLNFTTLECDPETGEVLDYDEGYEDEYQIEDIQIAVSDFIQPKKFNSFDQAWKKLSEKNAKEMSQTFSLSSMKDIKNSVSTMIDYLGMSACNDTDVVKKGSKKHLLLLAGSFVGNIPVLTKILMKLGDGAVQMKVLVKSTKEFACKAVVNAIY
ncbi:coatomer subunit gamma [Anaeramoeba flamelloides]|uniref:Coatomer subunit gamma n=1 Tax=Anaeramoeba flamelloides TaxID=1746091 RepID=A0AAV7Y4F4_9EUKA|nr:coatomer subunit gamma [Anaeramoeba flamelloides]